MISILVFFSSSALELTKFMTVWLVVVLIIIIFMILVVTLFKEHGEKEAFGFPDDFDIKTLIFWVLIVILAIGLTQVFGPVLTPYAADADPGHVILRTLFHPRVIGAVILIIIISNLAKLLKHEA